VVKQQYGRLTESSRNSKTTVVSSSRTTSTRTAHDELSLPCPETIEHDQLWQSELMALFGEIALKRDRECKPTYTSELIPGLRSSAEILNTVIMKLSANLAGNESEDYISEVIKRAAQYLSDVSRITRPVRRSWFGSGGSKAEPGVEEIAKLYCEFVLVLEQALNALGNRFNCKEYQLQWLKCSSVFLDEIRADMVWASCLSSRR
jgi:hypothetical protein